ncbi:carboxypeptidase-like regulatory domain-containing protein [Marinilabilia salmonicolor]|uniref:carboxypeptidase-like regulatory domain-containing protein n=1 Tax=Marinilabilia salmonicolor TaxID=989 RepID=UPI0002DCE9AE|nr:carboxypeptidase-like regulatory domain-containing protein [Marinilabilia salmonicolor]
MFLLSLFIVFSACEDEEQRPINPLPSELSDAGWVVQASRPVGQQSWKEFNYVSIWAGSEYYTLEQADGLVSEGSFNWYVDDGVQKLKLQSNDRDFDMEFEVIRYDQHHLIARTDWGGTYEEWIFYSRQENLGGLVVDQRTAEPLQDVLILVKSHDDVNGQLRTDEFGYFGMERYEFVGSGMNEVNKLQILKTEFEDIDEYVGFGQFYFFEMQQGESGLNFATISGRVTDEKTGAGIPGAEVSFGEAGNVVTDYDGYYEISVPIDETELAALAEGYDPVSQSVTLEGMQEYSLDFILPLSGVVLGGGIDVVGGGNATGATLSLLDENQQEAGSMVVDVNGNFSMEGVPDGLYVVSPSLAGMQFVPSQQFVQVSGDDVSDIHFLAMAEGKTGIGGQVTQWENDEVPLSGVVVTCGDQTFTTGADGYYLMELNSAGSVTVKGEKEGRIDRYKDVTIHDGNLVEQDLSMATFDEGTQLTITGNVSANGEPVANAVVGVSNNEETNTDVNGDYSLTITVYNETIIQYVELYCEKPGYSSESVFLSFYPEIPASHDFWLKAE